jgi:predicted Zn-dependent peptidase
MNQQKLIKNHELFVPVESESSYCQQHGIDFFKLDNGIILVGVARDVADSVETSINFKFRNGAWHDPKGKEGVHHLLEHIFNKNLYQEAVDLGCRVNASTSPSSMIEYLSGPVKGRVCDFGIWPMLKLVYQMLVDPRLGIDNLDELLITEKKVVEREIMVDKSEHGWLVKDWLLKWLFGDDNPGTIYAAGKLETVKKLEKSDLKLVMDESMVADKLIISVVTDSNKKILHKMMEELKKLYKEYPRQKSALADFPWKDTEKYRVHDPKKIKKISTGLKNGILSLTYCWRVEFGLLSKESFALHSVGDFVANKLFLLTRKNGWSYRSSTYPLSLSDRSGFVIIEMDIPTSDYSDERALEILKQIQKELSIEEHELKKITRLIQKNIEVRPVSIMGRLDWLLYGVDRYSRLVDVDKVWQAYLNLQQSDLEKWFELLTKDSPNIVVIGDFCDEK